MAPRTDPRNVLRVVVLDLVRAANYPPQRSTKREEQNQKKKGYKVRPPLAQLTGRQPTHRLWGYKLERGSQDIEGIEKGGWATYRVGRAW